MASVVAWRLSARLDNGRHEQATAIRQDDRDHRRHGGIGLSAAKACFTAGANLVLVGRNAQRAAAVQADFGEGIVVHVGDAMESETAVAVVEMAVKEFGRLDGLYHVAGGSGRAQGHGPLDKITDEGF